MDEQFVHQVPELLPQVETRSPHWRESFFYDIHSPDGTGDAVFFTMAHYPAREALDSLQMGRVGGQRAFGLQGRPYDGDPHTLVAGATRVEVVRPWQEIKLWADPDVCAVGLDLTFTARTQPYGLRRGTMRAHDAVVWDQCHILQSGTYTGTYSGSGTTYEVDGWVGQRDHSWGVRDHGRCPLWMWFQIQLEDGFLGVWHWEHENGSPVYTDGCWAGADGSDPIPVVRFEHDVEWVGAAGEAGVYGQHGETIAGLRGWCAFTVEGGRRIEVTADGRFDNPYEPFHRGGLSQMRVHTDDGREGTAIYEVTGARHHKYFPDAEVTAELPA
jgi:hypothetical protein